MKVNNILKIMFGVSTIAQKVGSNMMSECRNLVEDKIIKGQYVTREEFEVLQSVIIKLQQELTELKLLQTSLQGAPKARRSTPENKNNS